MVALKHWINWIMSLRSSHKGVTLQPTGKGWKGSSQTSSMPQSPPTEHEDKELLQFGSFSSFCLNLVQARFQGVTLDKGYLQRISDSPSPKKATKPGSHLKPYHKLLLKLPSFKNGLSYGKWDLPFKNRSLKVPLCM